MCVPSRNRQSRGFTLIELSIVLVIIGFLVAGIVVGQSMIRQSQINSVTADVQRYKAAILQFKEKYNYLPGDLPNARTYWGTDGSGCPENPGVSTTTCNGNGNGRIGSDLSNNQWWTIDWESMYLWQHLMMAGYITGSYVDGYVWTGANHGYFAPGITYPQSKITNAGFQVIYLGSNPKSGIYFDSASTPAFMGNYGHVMTFGMAESNWSSDPSYSGNPQYPALTTQEAYSIDQKLDDGQPYSGYIMAQMPGSYTLDYNNHCTATSGSTAVYDNTQGLSLACALIFLMQDF